MGSSGLSYRLIPTGKTAGSGTVKKAILSSLGDAWAHRRRGILSWDWKRSATDWIFLGEDSLLTVEVEGDAVTFWFYESVQWPQGIAQHWLLLAMAARRPSFEAALGRVGYRIDPGDWPDLRAVGPRGGRIPLRLFFECKGAIGEVTGSEVRWQIKDGSYEASSTAIEALDPEARAAADAAIAAGQCTCGACRSLFGGPQPEPALAPGLRAAQIALVATPLVRLIDHVNGAWILAAGGDYVHPTWVRAAASLDGPWATLTELTDESRHVELFARAGERVVAHLFTNSGARLLSTSDDGGRTWTAKAPHPQVPKLKGAQMAAGPAPGEVWMAGSPPKEIFRSTDGGQSFEVVACAPTVDGEPIAGFDALLPRAHDLVAVVHTKKKGTQRVAVSTDRGATFRQVAIAGLDAPRRLAARGDDVLVLGTTAGAIVVARSRDGAASWTVANVGPGRNAGIAAGPRGVIVGIDGQGSFGDGIHLSADGDRFTRAVEPGSAQVFADPTGEREGFFVVGRSLYALGRG